jgi:hypothetical protein
MRFFTRGWHQGDLTDDEAAGVFPAYAAHLNAISPRLPLSMQTLASDIDLHDAQIEYVEWDPGGKRLSVSLVTRPIRQPNLQSVVLTYERAQLGWRNLETLRDVARDRETEVLYHEVDLAHDGGFVHRILFWPRDELTIDFSGLSLEVRDREHNRFRLKPYFHEIIAEDDED